MFAFLALSTGPGFEIKELAIGLAAGIIFDATVVRALLVPALMRLLGDANWWMPKWLGTVLRIADPEADSQDRGTARARRLNRATERIAMETNTSPYPLRLTGELAPQLSRGLWLVKWLLAIPHFIVLVFLWIAFAVVSVIAFFAILFTGRYPRGLFDFNVGVLRWTWRVGFYCYSALGTDRYPPFTLKDVPDYPARLEVDVPRVALARARPREVVAARAAALPRRRGVRRRRLGDLDRHRQRADVELRRPDRPAGPLRRRRAALHRPLPASLYDFVLGMNRWVFRVVAYAALMTDVYPPFRLDMGGGEPPTDTIVPAIAPALAQ